MGANRVNKNYPNVFIENHLPIQNNAMYISMDHLGFDESVVAGPKPQGGFFFHRCHYHHLLYTNFFKDIEA